MSTQTQNSLENAVDVKLADAVINRAAAFTDVQKERERQVSKWGLQNHPLGVWTVINGEEMGETAQNVLQGVLSDFRTESIQFAAVAIAAAESATMQQNDVPVRTKYAMSDDEITAYNKLMYYVGILAHGLLENNQDEQLNALGAIIDLSSDWYNQDIDSVAETDYIPL